MTFAKAIELQGTLHVQSGRKPVLRVEGKEISLNSADENVASTLEDSRLSGRDLKVSGEFGPDGIFQVEDLFVVRNGKLFKLIYFCFTCNITAFRPGICQCCQQPTVPLEVPPGDPRIHHEELPKPKD